MVQDYKDRCFFKTQAKTSGVLDSNHTKSDILKSWSTSCFSVYCEMFSNLVYDNPEQYDLSKPYCCWRKKWLLLQLRKRESAIVTFDAVLFMLLSVITYALPHICFLLIHVLYCKNVKQIYLTQMDDQSLRLHS